MSIINNTIETNQANENLISIIIATYNAAGKLPGCLTSIANQHFKNFEVIIIDGGSTDNTKEVLLSFNQLKSVWVTEKDEGIYHALNKGIKIAKGNWFYFLGADDRLLPSFSELAYKLMLGNTVYYGYSNGYFEPGNEPSFEILTGAFSKYRLAKYCLNHQAIIYPANAFKNYQYDVKYRVLADYAFNLKLWGDNSFKKIFYPIAVASYDMSGFSSYTVDLAFKKDKPKLILEGMGRIVYLRFLLKKYKKRMRGEVDFE